MSDNQTLPRRVYEQLQACTTCFELSGPVLARVPRPAEFKRRPDGNGNSQLAQVYGSGDLPDYHKYCDCQGKDEAQQPLAYRKLWPNRGEVGAACELCYACALELRDLSSKWSLIVCRACLPVLQRANEAAGRLLFPVGWHSIVNSTAGGRIQPAPQSPGQVLQDPRGLIAYAQLQHAGIEGMRRWRSTAVALNLKASGLLDGQPPARVPLPELFEACKRARCSRGLRAAQMVLTTRP